MSGKAYFRRGDTIEKALEDCKPAVSLPPRRKGLYQEGSIFWKADYAFANVVVKPVGWAAIKVIELFDYAIRKKQ